MNRLKKVSVLLLGLLTLGSIYINRQFDQRDQSMTKVNAWSGAQTSNEGNYYSSVTGSETATALQSKLKGIISTGTSESYDWSRYEAADEAEGQSDSYLTPAYGGDSNLTGITNYARSNPGSLYFSVSMSEKIYALELVIASASSRTLPGEVNVS